jgi:hypothetical protein
MDLMSVKIHSARHASLMISMMRIYSVKKEMGFTKLLLNVLHITTSTRLLLAAPSRSVNNRNSKIIRIIKFMLCITEPTVTAVGFVFFLPDGKIRI